MGSKKKERHAQLPVRVMLSEAYKTLGYFERSVLVALCAEYTGYNNGKLALTSVQADEKYGIKGKRRFYAAIAELEHRALIRCTYRGQLRQFDKKHSPSRYALTFRAQDEHPEYKVRAEAQPRHSYENWRGIKKPGPPGGYGNPPNRTHPRIREKALPDSPTDTESVPARGAPLKVSPPRGDSQEQADSQQKPAIRRASNG